MNLKKVIFGCVGIALLVYLLLPVAPPVQKGSKCEAMVPGAVKTENLNLADVHIYADFSGSMRGFIDFANILNGDSVKNNFISTIGNFINKVNVIHSAETNAIIGNQVYSAERFMSNLRNGSNMNVGVTKLHDIFAKAAESVTDSTLSVVLSDMVLSYGKSELINKKDTFYNKHQLDALGNEIHTVMSQIAKKGYDVVFLKYTSSFNGKYYYNYTENLRSPGAYNLKHMENRPFYLALIGKEEMLKGLLETKCVVDFVKIYTSFDSDIENSLKPATFIIEEGGDKKKNIWIIGNEKNAADSVTVSIWNSGDYGDVKSKLRIKCQEFKVPEYLGKLDSIYVVSNCSDVSASVDRCERATGISLIVNIGEHQKLSKNNCVTLEVYKKNGKSEWKTHSSIDDDVNKKLDDLKGKTWGFSTIIDYTDKAFFSNGRKSEVLLGKLNFGIIKE